MAVHGLASYASWPDQSRGRAFATSASPTRNPFQRDRDRIIHSTAFRRLQYKTQVFLHHEGQHFRTRLTHTLEVSQIARSIARALRFNEDLAEAIALAHDLGHTPFGHAGERVLEEKLKDWGGFDHNLQALRVVTRLENRYADHDGLNLTWETLEGILKHNGPLANDAGVNPFAQELAGIVTTHDLMVDTHASLEAQVAAIADDIAYNAHDIDDAIRAGLLGVEQLVDVPLVGSIAQEVQETWPDLAASRKTHEIQRRLLTRTIEAVIVQSEKQIETVGPRTADEVRHCGRTLIAFPPAMVAEERTLKAFLFANVYRHRSVMDPIEIGQAVVARLFDAYFSSGNMPGRWHDLYRHAGNDQQARAAIVRDFLAGMTDPFALDEYERLFDARPDFR